MITIRMGVPIGAFLPPLAFTLHPEGTDVGSVALVVGCGAGKLEQHVADRLRLTN